MKLACKILLPTLILIIAFLISSCKSEDKTNKEQSDKHKSIAKTTIQKTPSTKINNKTPTPTPNTTEIDIKTKDKESFEVVWNKTYGGDGDEQALSAHETKEGGYAFEGVTCTKNPKKCKLWLVRLDEKGKIISEKKLDLSENVNISSMRWTGDGGYIAAGSTWGGKNNCTAPWVLKLNSEGEKEWEKIPKVKGEAELTGIVHPESKNFVLIGTYSKKCEGSPDAWIVKINLKGKIQWKKTYGGDYDDWPNALIESEDGGFVMTGTKGVGTNSDLWVLKLDSEGEKIWEKTFGGTKDDGAYAIARTLQKEYVIAGYTRSKGKGRSSIWVLKIDSDGKLLWDTTHGSGDETAYSVTQMSHGDFMVAGTSHNPELSSTDIVMLNLDQAGELKWTQTFGDKGNDNPISVIRVNLGVLMIGESRIRERKNDIRMVLLKKLDD